MDVRNILILIFVQIVLVISEKREDAGSNIKTLTEKACKFANHITNTTSLLNNHNALCNFLYLILDANLFQERRKESKELLRIIRDESVYERKYRLLEGAYDKLLNVRQMT